MQRWRKRIRNFERHGNGIRCGERSIWARASHFFIIIALIALLGLADATYLTVSHLAGDTSVCGASQPCSIVLGSKYAVIGGIPTAAFGVLAYFSAFSAATLAAFGYRRARTFLTLIIVGMFAVTLWFLYLQAFVLHAFCPFCLFSAAVTFCLAGLTLGIPPGRWLNENFFFPR
jgi:uncharacterized membrane protein